MPELANTARYLSTARLTLPDHYLSAFFSYTCVHYFSKVQIIASELVYALSHSVVVNQEMS